MGSARILNLLNRTATDGFDRQNNAKKALYFFWDAWHDRNSRSSYWELLVGIVGALIRNSGRSY